MVCWYVHDNDYKFTIQVNFIVKCVWGSLDPMVFMTDTVIAKWLANIGRTLLVAWATQDRTQLSC